MTGTSDIKRPVTKRSPWATGLAAMIGAIDTKHATRLAASGIDAIA